MKKLKLNFKMIGFLNINEIDAMELKPTDEVICLHSRVKGRTGTIYKIIAKNMTKSNIADNKVTRKYLSFLCSYGDKFQKV